MWTDIEIKKLESTLEHVELDHILTEQEIEIVKENSTRYTSLKSEIIVPKHNKEVELFLEFSIFILFSGENNPD